MSFGKISKDDELAVARFQRHLQRAVRDLAAGLGLRPKDLPHAHNIVLVAMLKAWHDGGAYEHDKNTLPRKPRPYESTPLEAKLPEGVFDNQLTDADKTPVRNVWDHKSRR